MSVEVHHRVEGPDEAPVVVLVGSLGTTLEMWDEQARALAERFRVLRYDMRGHGRSPVPAGPYSIADLAEDLVALLDRLGIERAAICGLSIGGMTAMAAAHDHPSRVDRLILCCTSAHMPPAEAWHERATTVRAQGAGAVADAVLERWFTPGFAASHPEVVASLRQGLAETPAEGYASCCEAIADLDLRDSLAAIEAPTLVISGAEDPATPPEHGRLIADGIPGASLRIVEGAAHLANIEQPAAITAALFDHLGAGATA